MYYGRTTLRLRKDWPTSLHQYVERNLPPLVKLPQLLQSQQKLSSGVDKQYTPPCTHAEFGLQVSKDVLDTVGALADLGRRVSGRPTVTDIPVWGRIRVFVKAVPVLLRQQRSSCHDPSGRMLQDNITDKHSRHALQEGPRHLPTSTETATKVVRSNISL